MNADRSPFDLSRAPFHVADGADATRVAAEMEACFRGLAGQSGKVAACFEAAVASAAIDEGLPLVAAGRRIAADVDAGLGDGDGNPYHNAQHFCEVLLGTLCLARFVPLDAGEKALLLFAALMHDFHHDGRIVKGVPFRLERLALEKATPYLEAAGVDARERERIAALVLATFVPSGVPFARHCYRHHFLGDPRPEPPPDPGALRMLADNARLAMLATLLTEADVLASVGLTPALGEEAQRKIAGEMDLAMGPADKLFFLETVFGRFEVGTFFAPNLEAMKQAMRERAQ